MPVANTQDEGVLTIGAIDMNPSNGAWGIVGDERGKGGLLQLWVDTEVRGEDRLLPGATGVIPYPRRVTVKRCDLRLIVVGDVIGQTGDPVSDQRIGLQANMEYLYDEVIEPPGTSTGMRGVSLTMPDATVRTGFFHVLAAVTQTYRLEECASVWIATLQVSLPYGRLT